MGKGGTVHVAPCLWMVSLWAEVVREGRWSGARRVAGRLDAPKVGGHLTVGKGSFTCPYLRYPVTGVAATVHVEEAGALRVEQLDARVGRRGHIKVRGHLPLQPPTRR